ncbi:MAG: hypothetical protein WCT49_02040 [Candidatus Paceibacterota bacterium]|jgi:hypothetical protein|nr:hypothetical protein [Candidatus Paceibacterota bacterium]
MGILEIVAATSGGVILCISLLNVLAPYVSVFNSDASVNVLAVIFMILIAVWNIKVQRKEKLNNVCRLDFFCPIGFLW